MEIPHIARRYNYRGGGEFIIKQVLPLGLVGSTGLNSGFDPVDDMPWQRIFVNKIFTEHAATYR